MPTVGITYLTLDGRFRKRQGKLDDQFALFLTNQKDKQTHVLVDRPIYPKLPAITLKKWDDLYAVAPPPPAARTEGWQLITEDNFPWPISTNYAPSPVARQEEWVDYTEEGIQTAQIRAGRDSAGNPLLHTAGVAAVVVFCLFSVMIAAIVAQNKWGGGKDKGIPVEDVPQASISKSVVWHLT